MKVNIATPIAVRHGLSRGRSSRLWAARSPVMRRSIDGHMYRKPNTTDGTSNPPKNGLGKSV